MGWGAGEWAGGLGNGMGGWGIGWEAGELDGRLGNWMGGWGLRLPPPSPWYLLICFLSNCETQFVFNKK